MKIIDERERQKKKEEKNKGDKCYSPPCTLPFFLKEGMDFLKIGQKGGIEFFFVK